jgi:predicted nucleic acid-binding protein
VAVVVDSSILIDYVSSGGLDEFHALIGDEPLFLPPLVVSEVLSGADDLSARVLVGELLQDTPVYRTRLAHWIDLGTLRRNLRRRGINVTLPDAHVAQCALDLDATLITRDKVFQLVAKHVPLRLA